MSTSGSNPQNLPDTSKVALRDILDEIDGCPRRGHTEHGGQEHPWIEGPCIQSLNGIIGQPTSPIAMVHRHAVDGCQTIIVREVEDDNVKEERTVGGLNLILWPEVNGDIVFPVFQLLVKLADGIEQFAIRLLGCFGGVESFVDPALDGGEFAKRSEEIKFPFAVSEWDITDIIWRVFARQFDIHIIVILYWWPARSETDAVQY